MARQCKTCGRKESGEMFCSPECEETDRWISEAHAHGPVAARSVLPPEPEPVPDSPMPPVCIGGVVFPFGEYAVLMKRRTFA
jgi:hypothetical protein